jgi:hypothetical protein
VTRPPWDVLKRVVLWLLCGLTMISGYGLTKLEPFGPAHLLPMTWLDSAIPFWPLSIWFYGTATWAALLAFLQAPDRVESRRLFFAVALAACCCWWFFLLFPTTYPRHLYPLPAGLDRWTQAQWDDLRGKDTPSNCFPSQHVALAWSLGLTWAAFQRRRWAVALPIAWAALVTLGTLTTKQHYVWDLPPGFAIGVGSFALMQWGIRPAIARAPARPLSLSRDADRRAIAALRARVEAHQWRLDDIAWPKGPLEPLDPLMARLLNHVIWIEEIAGLNFRVLEHAAADDDLRVIYGLFADEERRHADGLRQLLALHGAATERPGLGNALVLDQFDTIDANSEADAILVAVSNPVFETFLDAGTIPFLQKHPALRGPAFDALVERINADEGAHLAANWLVTREMARRYPGVRGLRFLANPAVWRGMLGVPWMSLDVYSLAWRLGFRFESLLPAFWRLWRLHDRHPELGPFPLWWMYRWFTICGLIATYFCVTVSRAGLLGGWFWIRFTRVTDHVAWLAFGDRLLSKRSLRLPSPASTLPRCAPDPPFPA